MTRPFSGRFQRVKKSFDALHLDLIYGAKRKPCWYSFGNLSFRCPATEGIDNLNAALFGPLLYIKYIQSSCQYPFPVL